MAPECVSNYLVSNYPLVGVQVHAVTKGRAPLMPSRYICVTVAFESIHGLIEKNDAMVTHW